MNRLFILAVAGASCLAPLTANAADLIVPPEYAPPPPVVSTSGWYLRGDVGYGFKSDTDGYYNFWNQGGLPGFTVGVDNTEHYDNISLKGAATYGVGVGYRYNEMLRGDLTVDYMKADVEGTSRCAYPIEQGYGLDPVNNSCHYEDRADASIWTTMANAYVDLPRFSILTPYIGAGVGAAYVQYGDLHGSVVCGPGCDSTDVHEGEDSWRFAAAFMAGASFDVTQQLKLDAGYRFLHVNGGAAFGYDAIDRASGASGVQGNDNGFNIHQVRVGLRYEFF